MKIPLFTRLFSQFLPSNEAKNASRMPLEYLSNPSKMPFVEIYKQQNSQFYGRRSLSCRHQHVRLQGLKRKCFPHAQSADTNRNRERFDRKMGKNIVHKDVRFVPAPCSPAILHPCVPVPLRPYTLHLTPYTLRFHFPLRHFWPFAVVKMQNGRSGRGRVACLLLLLFYAFLSFFLTRGDTSRRAGPHPPLSPHDVAIPGYGASRRRSACAACRWVCRSPRR